MHCWELHVCHKLANACTLPHLLSVNIRPRTRARRAIGYVRVYKRGLTRHSLQVHFLNRKRNTIGVKDMGNSFRRQPGPTLYDELKTPVTEDVLQVGLLFAFAIIAFSFILIIPGIRGNEVSTAGCRLFKYYRHRY